MTIMSEAARAKKIEDLLAAQAGQTDVERITLPWQDSKGQTFPVIKMPLDHVVLNSNSHRIREQLESDPKRSVVQAGPLSEEGQAVITEILTNIEGFEDLQANLREEGQRDPGVITRAGVLINANTRAVALRENDPKGWIRVAVLPPNADPNDIVTLELRLQMRRDFKKDYTFVNQLLFVEDLRTKLKYNDEEIAKAMNLALSDDKAALRKGTLRAQQLTRLLATVRDIQSRSGGKIPLNFFNAASVALVELDAQYEDLRKSDPPAAEHVKESRILGILVGTQYRNLRSISATSAIEKVVPMLVANDEIGTSIEAIIGEPEDAADLPGLDELADEPANNGDKAPTVKPLVDLIAQNWDNTGSVALPSGEGATTSIALDELKNKIAEELDGVHEEVVREDRATKSLSGPIQLVKAARSNASLALVAYQKVATNPGFKNGNLKLELKKLEHAVEALRAEFAKHK